MKNNYLKVKMKDLNLMLIFNKLKEQLNYYKI